MIKVSDVFKGIPNESGSDASGFTTCGCFGAFVCVKNAGGALWETRVIFHGRFSDGNKRTWACEKCDVPFEGVEPESYIATVGKVLRGESVWHFINLRFVSFVCDSDETAKMVQGYAQTNPCFAGYGTYWVAVVDPMSQRWFSNIFVNDAEGEKLLSFRDYRGGWGSGYGALQGVEGAVVKQMGESGGPLEFGKVSELFPEFKSLSVEAAEALKAHPSVKMSNHPTTLSKDHPLAFLCLKIGNYYAEDSNLLAWAKSNAIILDTDFSDDTIKAFGECLAAKPAEELGNLLEGAMKDPEPKNAEDDLLNDPSVIDGVTGIKQVWEKLYRDKRVGVVCHEGILTISKREVSLVSDAVYHPFAEVFSGRLSWYADGGYSMEDLNLFSSDGSLLVSWVPMLHAMLSRWTLTAPLVEETHAFQTFSNMWKGGLEKWVKSVVIQGYKLGAQISDIVDLFCRTSLVYSYGYGQLFLQGYDTVKDSSVDVNALKVEIMDDTESCRALQVAFPDWSVKRKDAVIVTSSVGSSSTDRFINVISDKAKYGARPVFAYQLLMDDIMRSKASGEQYKFDPDSVPIGVGMDGIPFRLGLKDLITDLIIRAGSRSGKGVLTQYILTCVMLYGGEPVYIDGKPDTIFSLISLFDSYGIPFVGGDTTKTGPGVLGDKLWEGGTVEHDLENEYDEFFDELWAPVRGLSGFVNQMEVRRCLSAIKAMSLFHQAFSRGNGLTGTLICDECSAQFFKNIGDYAGRIQAATKEVGSKLEALKKKGDDVSAWQRLYDWLSSIDYALSDVVRLPAGIHNTFNMYGATVIMIGQKGTAEKGSVEVGGMDMFNMPTRHTLIGREMVGTESQRSFTTTSDLHVPGRLPYAQVIDTGVFCWAEKDLTLESAKGTVFRSGLLLTKNDVPPTRDALYEKIKSRTLIEGKGSFAEPIVARATRGASEEDIQELLDQLYVTEGLAQHLSDFGITVAVGQPNPLVEFKGFTEYCLAVTGQTLEKKHAVADWCINYLASLGFTGDLVRGYLFDDRVPVLTKHCSWVSRLGGTTAGPATPVGVGKITFESADGKVVETPAAGSVKPVVQPVSMAQPVAPDIPIKFEEPTTKLKPVESMPPVVDDGGITFETVSRDSGVPNASVPNASAGVVFEDVGAGAGGATPIVDVPVSDSASVGAAGGGVNPTVGGAGPVVNSADVGGGNMFGAAVGSVDAGMPVVSVSYSDGVFTSRRYQKLMRDTSPAGRHKALEYVCGCTVDALVSSLGDDYAVVRGMKFHNNGVEIGGKFYGMAGFYDRLELYQMAQRFGNITWLMFSEGAYRSLVALRGLICNDLFEMFPALNSVQVADKVYSREMCTEEAKDASDRRGFGRRLEGAKLRFGGLRRRITAKEGMKSPAKAAWKESLNAGLTDHMKKLFSDGHTFRGIAFSVIGGLFVR